ncbi:MAG: acyl-CoA dehydrogenase [Deltaproteobacteria bacterium]|nr:acyl-CoA dehydrogenase [Deltaproteobacteria bacterium]
MNFDWIPEEKELADKTAALFDPETRSELEAMEQAGLEEIRAITLRRLGRLAEIGYLHVGTGPEAERETTALIAAQEQLARLSGSLFLAVETTARLFGGLLEGFGDGQNVTDILEPLRRGELIAAVAISETEERDAPEGPVTWARRDGDGYVLTGRKSFVTNGPIADFVAVLADSGGKSVVCLVERTNEGVSVGPRLRTLGYNGLAVASIEFKDVKVPAKRALGPFDSRQPLDYLTLMQDLVLTMASVGLMHRAVCDAKDYAQSHLKGGKPIFRFQEIRFKLAEMLTLAQTAQLLAYRAGWLYSLGDKEALGVMRCAKVFSSEAAEQVTGLAMQITAGQGYLWDSPIQRAYREAKYASIAGTTSEVARMAIADELLTRRQV